MKNEKENMPFIDTVAIFAEIYGAVCQLYVLYILLLYRFALNIFPLENRRSS